MAEVPMRLLSLRLIGCSSALVESPLDRPDGLASLRADGGPHPAAEIVVLSRALPERPSGMPWRASFDLGEVVTQGRWPDAPEVGVSLVAWGTEGSMRLVDAVAPELEGTRQLYRHEGIEEWWTRGSAGLEHGFVVAAPPPAGALVVELAIRGARAVIDGDGLSASLVPDVGPPVRYQGLAAWDADGADLPAWMEATPGGVRLVVDVKGARGAVTMDPLLPGATWSAEGGQDGAHLGTSVASAGDVNGDGFADLLVGAPKWDDAFTDQGASVLYLGSPTGLGVAPSWIARGGPGAQLGSSVASAGDVNGDGYHDVIVGAPSERSTYAYLGSPAGLSAVPAWSAADGKYNSDFGASVASAGDVDADGYDDVIVGSPFRQNGPFQGRRGAAALFRGSATGLGAAPSWRVEGGVTDGRYGDSVASAGDVNGDGYDDVVVGAPGFDNAYVYLGSAAGLRAAPAWSAVGPAGSAYFGQAVASAGDVNGDGYDDVVVGAPGNPNGEGGTAFLYLGSAAGLSAAPAWTVQGDEPYGAVGSAVAGAGDVDGDGLDDVLVGAESYRNADGGHGAAFLFLGTPGGLSAAPAWFLDSDQDSSKLGASVASAGDVDGDGRADLAIGAPWFHAGQPEEGAAFVYVGVLDDTDGDGVIDGSDLCGSVFDPDQRDTDADGIGDACDDPILALVGVPSVGAHVTLIASGVVPGEVVQFGAAPGGGAAGPCPAVLGGLCLGLGPSAQLLGQATSDVSGRATRTLVVPAAVQPNGTYALQATIVRGVGGVDSVGSNVVVADGSVLDWDGDGLVDATELLAGTDPRVADTDGDGLIDGDERPHFDPLDPDSDGDGVADGADQCFVDDDAQDTDADGAPDACDVCPSLSDPGQLDGDRDGLGTACDGAVLLPSGWTMAGDAFASAGDVNGDGYDDVIVGEPQVGNFGRASVYLGGAAGVAPAPAWLVAGSQSARDFGRSVGSAGDVDGDGYDEVIVGGYRVSGPYSDVVARVFVFRGSAAGLAGVPAWVRESGSAEWGATTGSADVNADGYGDVIVGSSSSDLQLFMGGPGGLAAAPTWSATGGDGFGTSVASADVNGDGHDDVLVGEGYYEGAAHLYLGAPAGLSDSPIWQVYGDRPGANLGASVASAGDVDGDGYADMMVGAPGRDSRAGTVFLYLGGTMGLALAPAWSVSAQEPYANLGTALASPGDVNGDGYDDISVGAPFLDFPGGEGAALVYLGSPDGRALAPAFFAGGAAGLQFGASLAGGDFNGDGLGDLVVGDLSSSSAWHGHTP